MTLSENMVMESFDFLDNDDPRGKASSAPYSGRSNASTLLPTHSPSSPSFTPTHPHLPPPHPTLPSSPSHSTFPSSPSTPPSLISLLPIPPSPPHSTLPSLPVFSPSFVYSPHTTGFEWREGGMPTWGGMFIAYIPTECLRPSSSCMQLCGMLLMWLAGQVQLFCLHAMCAEYTCTQHSRQQDGMVCVALAAHFKP